MITLEKELKTSQKQDLIDKNDLQYVAGRLVPGVQIVGMEPAPFTKGRFHWNTTNFFVRYKKTFATISIFHVKPVYYLNKWGHRRPLGEILSHHGNRYMQLKAGWEELADFAYITWLVKRQALLKQGLLLPYSRVPLLLNVDYFPDPDVESTSVDGYIKRTSSNSTWASLHDGVGTVAADSGANDYTMTLESGSLTDTWTEIIRHVCLFDTSAIPNGDTISDATISLFGSSKDDTAFSQSVTVVVCNPATNTALVAGDYDIANWTMTAQNTTDITVASWSNTAYNDISFNATGRGNVSKTGVSKFGTVGTSDRNNIPPTWATSNLSQVISKSADTAGTTNDPKLAVTSSAAAAKIRGGLSLLRVG